MTVRGVFTSDTLYDPRVSFGGKETDRVGRDKKATDNKNDDCNNNNDNENGNDNNNRQQTITNKKRRSFVVRV